MAELKLFVVGERSSDPDDWNEWGSRAIVLAGNPDEARRLCGDLFHDDDYVTEIPLTGEPVELAYVPRPSGRF